MSREIAALLLFAVLNVAVLFYKHRFTYAAAAYLATLVLLYTAYLFFDALATVTLVFYCLVSAYLIIKEKRLLILAFALINHFICEGIIAIRGGWPRGMTLAELFGPELDPFLFNTVDDAAGVAWTFMCIGVPIFLLVQLISYAMRRKNNRE